MRMAQIRLLDAIGGLEKSLGRLPSMNEIARVLGCSPQNVHKMIKRMRSKNETLRDRLSQPDTPEATPDVTPRFTLKEKNK